MSDDDDAATQCEKHPDCTRGYRHGGFGGKCSLRRAKPVSHVRHWAVNSVERPSTESWTNEPRGG